MTLPMRLLALLAIAVVLALTAPMTRTSAVATNWYVDPAGNDTNDCLTPASACLTVQAAINKASSGDTINVAAGTYAVSGLVSVNKTLTLLGAQAGVDARTRAASESRLQNSQGMSVSASNVIIDGFTVELSTVSAFTGYGIWLNPGVSGTHIVNNIIQNNIVGIALANAGPSQALIQHNLIQTNNQPGGASGTGIYTDEFVGGQVTNVLIDANKFLMNDNAGVAFSSTDTTIPDSNIDIGNNAFDQNGRGIYFYNTNNALVHDNSITNSTNPTDGGTSVAIAAFGDVNGLTILNNDLLTGALRGIRVGSFNVNPNTNVQAHINNIVGFAQAGLYVDAGGHVGPVDGTCNWWGSATGPTNPSNPPGTGDAVIGSATFNPWLVAPAPNGPCVGGLPATATPQPTDTATATATSTNTATATATNTATNTATATATNTATNTATATRTATATSTRTATATPVPPTSTATTAPPTTTPAATSTGGPVRVGGIADVHVGGGPGTGAASATPSDDGGASGRETMAFSLAASALVALGIGGWCLRRRIRS